MSETVITVEGLSKRYLIAHNPESQGHRRYVAFRDVIGRAARNLARKSADMLRGRQVLQGNEVEEFWALKNVSFEVKQGEVLGIIGRNGAGKSTLLKILSRITDPTEGRVRLQGRVGSLLEVGTGFHPELTGRENIYLNGAILGMTRREISKKFGEIVDFAEVEKFLDTPVKRYSSGMYVRLAFAVAAHLEPEILVVDEVLAVGDAEFQKKCLGKMEDVSRRDGRTVLFVSHNMGAIAELASRAVLLDGGCITIDGSVSEAVSAYLSHDLNQPIYISPYDDQHEAPHIFRAEVLTPNSNGAQAPNEPFGIKVWIRHLRPLVRGCLGVQIINQFRVPAIAVHAYAPECVFGKEPGTTIIQFHIPQLRLNFGHFHLRIWLTEPPGDKIYEVLDGVCGFEIMRHDTGMLLNWTPDTCIYREEFFSYITEIATDQKKLLALDKTEIVTS
jgi:ABC-type polysaccharide/polyol phosphate transport system ATPase subunit